jgi:hypothetical protein
MCNIRHCMVHQGRKFAHGWIKLQGLIAGHSAEQQITLCTFLNGIQIFEWI